MYLDRTISVLTLLTIYYFGLAAPAHAYFDLGTGTYILQMILGLGAAFWLSLRTSYIKIDRKLKAKTSPSAPEQAPEELAAAQAQSQESLQGSKQESRQD
jgi:hypothetical protein